MKIDINEVSVRNEGVIEIIPCDVCKLHNWASQESRVIQYVKKLESVFEAVSCFAFLMETPDGVDWNECSPDFSQLQKEIDCPCKIDSGLPEPYELGSQEIKDLKESLWFVASFGITDIPLQPLISAYRKLFHLAVHVEGKHRDADGNQIINLGVINGDVPENVYSRDFLMRILPYVQGRSVKEFLENCAKEMTRRMQDLGIK